MVSDGRRVKSALLEEVKSARMLAVRSADRRNEISAD
jgi:hypothetical protein